ncbi:hypothetical protein PYW07_011724 [Mythimna separata]|uniref:Apple domain-containing protein n=1 Tax=Mythimna separata TaxID=271217 RepID=A0AAD7Y6N0_MYTSE|nr:hypothetical protein PYW07_011724 [Mythimna separata]
MLNILVLCPVLLAAAVQTLTIDSQLGTSIEDCFERISIGEQLPPDAIYRNVTELTTRECEQICKQDKQCQSYDYGVGAKGNATCNLSKNDEKSLKEMSLLLKHPDYDVYVRRVLCEQSPPSPIQGQFDDPSNGPGPAHRPVFRPVDDPKQPFTDDYLISGDLESYGVSRPVYKPQYDERPDDYSNPKPDFDTGPSYGAHKPQDMPYRPERPGQDGSKPRPDPQDVLQLQDPYRPNDRPGYPSNDYNRPRPGNPYELEKPEYHYIIRPTRKPRPQADTGYNKPTNDYPARPGYGQADPGYTKPTNDYPRPGYGQADPGYTPGQRPYPDKDSYDRPRPGYQGPAGGYGQSSPYDDNVIHVEIVDPPRPYKPPKPTSGQGIYGYGTYSSQHSYSQSQSSQSQYYGSAAADTGYGSPYRPDPRPERPGYGELSDTGYGGGTKPQKPSNDRPVYGAEKPGYGNDKPSYANDRPSYGNDRPSYGNDRPSYGAEKPSNDYDKPAYGNEKPWYGNRPINDRPAYGSDRPSNDRPLYGSEKPSYDKPAYGNDRPSYGNDRPSNDKPSYGSDRPSNDRPSYGAEKPAADSGYGNNPYRPDPKPERPGYGEQSDTGYGGGSKPQKPINDRPAYVPATPGYGNQVSYGSNHASFSSQSEYNSHHASYGGQWNKPYGQHDTGYGLQKPTNDYYRPSYGTGSYGGSQGGYGSNQSLYGQGSFNDGAYGAQSSYGGSQGSYGSGYGSGSYGGSQGSYGTQGSYGSSQSSQSTSSNSYGSQGSFGSQSDFNGGSYGGSQGSYAGSSGSYGGAQGSYGTQNDQNRPSYGNRPVNDKPAYGKPQKPKPSNENDDADTGYGKPPTFDENRPDYVNPNDPGYGSDPDKPGYGSEKPTTAGYDKPNVKPVYEYELEKPGNVPSYIARPGGEVVTSRPMAISEYEDAYGRNPGKEVYKEEN